LRDETGELEAILFMNEILALVWLRKGSGGGTYSKGDLEGLDRKSFSFRADSLRPTQIVEQSGRVCSENLVHANTGQHHGSYFVLHYPPDTVESTVMDKNRDQPESSYPKSSLLFYSTLGLT
jgi:hypothetical protein